MRRYISRVSTYFEMFQDNFLFHMLMGECERVVSSFLSMALRTLSHFLVDGHVYTLR